MDNTTKKLTKNKELNLSELIWSLIIRWRLLLLLGIICGLLGAGLFYIKDRRSISQQTPAQQTAVSSARQPDTDLITVNALLNYLDTLNTYRYYFDNSLLMHVDAANETVLTLQYSVTAADTASIGTSSTISDFYCTELVKPLAILLKDYWGTDASLSSISELIKMEPLDLNIATDRSVNVSTFFVRVIIPENFASEELSALLSDCIAAESARQLSGLPAHTLTCLFSDILNETDQKLVQDQYTFGRIISDLESIIATKQLTLTDAQKALYAELYTDPFPPERIALTAEELLHNNEAEPVVPEQDLTTVQPAVQQSPGFSKKGFVLGFGAGLFLYIIIYFFYCWFTSRIITPYEIESCLGLRTFGQIHSFPYKKGISRILFSLLLYRLHYREYTQSEKQKAAIADSVSSLCSHYTLNKVTLLALGKQTAASASLIEEIQKSLKESCPSVSIESLTFFTDSQSSAGFESSISTAENVIPIVLKRSTTADMIDSVIDLSKMYNISVLGTVFLEC